MFNLKAEISTLPRNHQGIMKKKEEHTHIKKYMYMSDANIIADDTWCTSLNAQGEPNYGAIFSFKESKQYEKTKRKQKEKQFIERN